MKKLPYILAALFICNVALAQNELAFGIFGNNGGVMLKHFLDDKKALRLYFSGNYADKSNKLLPDVKSTSVNLLIGFGYEWRKDLGEDFEFISGVDLGVFYGNNTSKLTSNGTDFTGSSNNLSFGLAPFVGGYYNFSKRMFILTEARIGVLSYTSTKTTSTQTNASSTNEQTSENTSTTSIGFVPTYTVGIGFRF